MKRSKLAAILAMILVFLMAVPAVASAATVKMAYSGGTLNLRSGPSRSSESLGTVRDGDTVTVQSYGDVWSKVKVARTGKVGYIKNLYIQDGDSNYATGTKYIDSYTAYTTATVNFRAGASTGTASMGTLKKGTKVKVLGTNDGWYLVENSKGTQGYLSGKYLSKTSSSSSSSSSSTTKKTTTATVNMRADGSIKSKVIQVVGKGNKVTVVYRGNYWTKCSYNGKTGWIKNTYLK